MSNATIKISEVIGGSEFVDSGDGNLIHQMIASFLEQGENVEVSFAGGTQMITAFSNAAIGQLYNEFTDDQIRSHLKLIDIPDGFSDTLIRSIERAKTYYANQAEVDQAMRDLGEE